MTQSDKRKLWMTFVVLFGATVVFGVGLFLAYQLVTGQEVRVSTYSVGLIAPLAVLFAVLVVYRRSMKGQSGVENAPEGKANE